MRCSARFSLRTGWKVPAPTCSVTAARRHAALLPARRARPRRSAAPRSARPPRPGARRTRSGSAPRPRARRRGVMYGGSGTWPWRLQQREGVGRKAQVEQRARPGRRGPAPRRRRRRQSAARLPGLGDLLARRWASTSWPGSTRSTSASTAPPLAFSPNSRALMTRVSLKTSRSPGCSSAGRSRKTRSHRQRGRGRRAAASALRSAAGCWAISSGGSSKSKSARVWMRGSMADSTQARACADSGTAKNVPWRL